jgi:flagellar hook assembly protein FlgD
VQHRLTVTNGIGKTTPVVVRFAVGSEASGNPVCIAVYNMRGSLIRQLYSGKAPAGENCIAWDGRGSSGKALANGSYLLNMEIGGKTQSRTVVMAR